MTCSLPLACIFFKPDRDWLFYRLSLEKRDSQYLQNITPCITLCKMHSLSATTAVRVFQQTPSSRDAPATKISSADAAASADRFLLAQQRCERCKDTFSNAEKSGSSRCSSTAYVCGFIVVVIVLCVYLV